MSVLAIPLHQFILSLVLTPQAKIVAADIQHFCIVSEVHNFRGHALCDLHSKDKSIVHATLGLIVAQHPVNLIRDNLQTTFALIDLVDRGFSLFA